MSAILDKIHGLLETTVERGASEAEAASAARLVEQILLKHGITEEEARASLGQDEREDYQCAFEGIRVGKGTNEELDWTFRIAGNVGPLLFCRAIIVRDEEQVAYLGFAGDPTSVKACIDLSRFLFEQGERLAAMAFDSKPEPQEYEYLTLGSFFGGKPWTDKPTFMRSFLVGFADRLTLKIKERIAERQEEAKAFDLARVKGDRVKEFLEGLGKDIQPQPAPKHRQMDLDALIKGYDAAKNTPLEVTRPIG